MQNIGTEKKIFTMNFVEMQNFVSFKFSRKRILLLTKRSQGQYYQPQYAPSYHPRQPVTTAEPPLTVQLTGILDIYYCILL